MNAMLSTKLPSPSVASQQSSIEARREAFAANTSPEAINAYAWITAMLRSSRRTLPTVAHAPVAILEWSGSHTQAAMPSIDQRAHGVESAFTSADRRGANAEAALQPQITFTVMSQLDGADDGQHRREAAALEAHQRDVREHSYLPRCPGLFFIH